MLLRFVFAVMTFALCSQKVGAQSLAFGMIDKSPSWAVTVQTASDTSAITRFFTPATSYSPPRMGIVLGTTSGLYAASSVALYSAWYKDFPLVGFHFFNDNAEWLQMDKFGHSLNAFNVGLWSSGLYKWAGVDNKAAYYYGATTGMVIMLTIEVFDGFSEKWGFSWGDFVANSVGAGLMAAQGVVWDEMRFQLKFSFHREDHPPDLEQRALDLYGSAFYEQLLKDYNGLTYWLSVNPSTFMAESSKFPKWLNFSVGYGAGGLYGGFANTWCADADIKPEECLPSQLIDRSDVARVRKYFLSVDVDLTRIQTRSQFLNTLFDVVNIIKIPAPTLELRQGDGLKWHWMYF